MARRVNVASEAGGGGHDSGMAEGADGPGRKPEWLKKPLPESAALRKMETLLRDRRLHTVCESALCPNLGECFARGTATFLIMGDVCTRDCGFCGVTSGRPAGLDVDEPQNVADAVAGLELRHVVVTSVTRDDLADGGAGHYVATVRAIRSRAPGVTVEVLVPDFAGRMEHLDLVLGEAPEVFNHNVETVPRLYAAVRPQAAYERSLAVLARAAERGRSLVKTGWMVGLGEREEEVKALLEEVAECGVDMVTIGQYLRPSGRHLPVTEYVRPGVFATYREFGEALGLQVHAAPFVRSSFQAGESFAQATIRGGRENGRSSQRRTQTS
ncbi:MAG: lipoyl synthase [bacterium]